MDYSKTFFTTINSQTKQDLLANNGKGLDYYVHKGSEADEFFNSLYGYTLTHQELFDCKNTFNTVFSFLDEVYKKNKETIDSEYAKENGSKDGPI